MRLCTMLQGLGGLQEILRKQQIPFLKVVGMCLQCMGGREMHARGLVPKDI